MLADIDMDGGQHANVGRMQQFSGRSLAAMATQPLQGRLLKAAMAIADMTASELGAAVETDIQVGRRTIERVMAGHRVLKPWEIDRIAEALDVPVWFLRDGLPSAEPQDHPSTAERLEVMITRLEELLARSPEDQSGEELAADARRSADEGLARARRVVDAQEAARAERESA